MSTASVERYFARVDDHLLTLPDRVGFLRREQEKWLARYQRFQMTVIDGSELTGDVSAWDFTETIAGISARLAQHQTAIDHTQAQGR